MKDLGIIDRKKTAFVQIDIQEKFRHAIHDFDKVISNAKILAEASSALNIPLIVTEQYPKGLGKTAREINLPENAKILEKLHFSCFGDQSFKKTILELNINTLIIYGVESHVCILKTALDAVKQDIEVHIAADAASSRTPENKSIALERMRQSGVFVASIEMILFQMLEYSGTDEFKAVSRLIK